MVKDIRWQKTIQGSNPSRFGLLIQRIFPNLPDWMWVALGAIPQPCLLFVEPEFTPARPRLRTANQPLLPRQRTAAHIPTIPISFTARTRTRALP